jgi:hypothetical protein
MADSLFTRSRQTKTTQAFWEGMGEWTGIKSGRRAPLRQVQWEELKAPCTVAFVTASREVRFGRLVKVASNGLWVALDGEEGYFWERELILDLALVDDIEGGHERQQRRSAALARVLRLHASHRTPLTLKFQLAAFLQA